jgi:hypothetical protein
MKDMARFFRRDIGLYPVNREARDIIAKLNEGSPVFVEIWLPRNMSFHRRYFTLLNRVVQSSGRWPSVEALSFDIMLALKRGTFMVARDGSTHFRPDSRAVASMRRDDFTRLYEDTMALLTEWLGADPELLLEEAA